MSSLATSCPDAGRWRAWLDEEPAGPTEELARHLAACPSCERLVHELRHNADVAAMALGGLATTRLPSAADVAAAREQLAAPRHLSPIAPVASFSKEEAPVSTRIVSTRTSTRTMFHRWRLAAGGVAAALALTALAVNPEGQALASRFLGQFRSEQFTVVEVSPQSQQAIQRTLQTLSNFGTVETPRRLNAQNEQNRPAVSLAEASKQVGFQVTEPDAKSLPASVDKTPKIQVMPGAQMRFKFEAAKARAYLQSQGQPNVDLPAKYDGATLVVGIPTAALLQYQAPGTSSREALVIGEAGEVTVGVEGGATLEELRDFMLGLPGLPKETVDQIKSIKDWSNTLPIPVPTDQVKWEKTDINGHPGLLLNDNSGVGSAAIFQAGGHLYGFAGSLKADALLNVARNTDLK